MKDRVPLYPGRVKLTPVSGQENVYDMVRADQPTQEGDPLNKSTFLTDNTASLFGLDDTAVPNDVFNILKNVSLIDNSEESYKATDVFGNVIGGFTNIEFGSYVGTGKYGVSNPNIITFSNTPKIIFIGGGGNSTYNGLSPFGGESIFKQTVIYQNPGSYRDTNSMFVMNINQKTFTFYSTDSVSSQLNASGRTYFYFSLY